MRIIGLIFWGSAASVAVRSTVDSVTTKRVTAVDPLTSARIAALHRRLSRTEDEAWEELSAAPLSDLSMARRQAAATRRK